MPTVTLATHCYSGDVNKLNVLELINSHQYLFDEVLIVHQRTNGKYNTTGPTDATLLTISESDYDLLLGSFGIPHRDPILSELTHGWSAAHYYEHHCVNHCLEIMAATSDYIVFNDADCKIIAQPSSWITKAVELMESDSRIFVVAPSDGGHEFNEMLPDGTRLTQTMSQQLFLGKRSELMKMDFAHLPWNGQFDAPYGPFQEFYAMMEGHIWRWMREHNLYRAVLPEQWRYWHN